MEITSPRRSWQGRLSSARSYPPICLDPSAQTHAQGCRARGFRLGPSRSQSSFCSPKVSTSTQVLAPETTAAIVKKMISESIDQEEKGRLWLSYLFGSQARVPKIQQKACSQPLSFNCLVLKSIFHAIALLHLLMIAPFSKNIYKSFAINFLALG